MVIFSVLPLDCAAARSAPHSNAIKTTGRNSHGKIRMFISAPLFFQQRLQNGIIYELAPVDSRGALGHVSHHFDEVVDGRLRRDTIDGRASAHLLVGVLDAFLVVEADDAAER